MAMTIESFLLEVRRHTKDGNLVIVPTLKNRTTRRMLGLSVVDLEVIVCNLSNDDFHEGPVEDRDRPNEFLYIFKTEYLDEMLYIKIKLQTDEARCISIHLDNI